MVYILVGLIIIISFIAIFVLRKNNRKYKKIKPLSKMTKKEFKKAMEDLEIK